MTPSSVSQPKYCARFDGTSIFAVGYKVALFFHRSAATIVRATGWKPVPQCAETFAHASGDDAVVRLMGPNMTAILARSKQEPLMARYREFGRFIFGPQQQPDLELMFPAALRVPLRLVPGAPTLRPNRPRRRAPIYPVSRQGRLNPFVYTTALGEKVELRASLTSGDGGERYYAEMFLGSHFIRRGGAPRVEFFPSDGRSVVPATTTDERKVFMREVLHQVLEFADSLGSFGLEVDQYGAHQLPVVATTHVAPDADDVWFDVRLATPTGYDEFTIH